MDSKKSGELICRLRKEKGYTQQQLADRLHVTNKAVSKWERGKGYPEITMLSELSAIFGISADELLSGQRYDNFSVKNAETPDRNSQETIRFTLACGLYGIGFILSFLLYFYMHDVLARLVSSVSLMIFLLIGFLVYFGTGRDDFSRLFHKNRMRVLWLYGLTASFLLGIMLSDNEETGIMAACAVFVLLRLFSVIYWNCVCRREAEKGHVLLLKFQNHRFLSASFLIGIYLCGIIFDFDYHQDILRRLVFVALISAYLAVSFLLSLKQKEYRSLIYGIRDAIVAGLFAKQVAAFAANRYFYTFMGHFDKISQDSALGEQLNRNKSVEISNSYFYLAVLCYILFTASVYLVKRIHAKKIN